MPTSIPTPATRSTTSAARRVSLRTVLLVAAGLSLAAAAPAPFHLRLTKSSPTANAALSAPPTSIDLWFSQPPELPVTSVKLVGPGASEVSLAPLTRAKAEGAPIVAAVKGTVSPGEYDVRWRTMAKDGHVVSGTFKFTVAAAGAP